MATQRTLLTAEDILKLPEEDCHYELLDGVLGRVCKATTT